MLTVYTYRAQRPPQALDLSETPLGELIPALLDVCSHHTSMNIWLGYLEGWMLSPQEEVLVRRAIRKFHCSLVTHFPLSLSHAWQNEIDVIYTTDPNGPSHIDNNGRALHDGSQAGHRHSGAEPPTDQRTDQDRKARRSKKG